MFAIAMFSLVMNANYALRKTFVFDVEEESDKQTDLMTFIKVIKGTTYNVSNPVDLLRITINFWKKSEADKLKEQKRLEKLEKEKRDKQRKLENEKAKEEVDKALKRREEELEKKKQEEQKRLQDARARGTSPDTMDVADVQMRQNSFAEREMEAEVAKLKAEAQRLKQQLEEEEEAEQLDNASSSYEEEDDQDDEFGNAMMEQARQNVAADLDDEESQSDKKSALNEMEMFGMPMDALQEDDERYAPPEDLEVRLKNLEVKEEVNDHPSIASEKKKVEAESKGMNSEP